MINQTHFDKQSLNCAQIYTMPVNIAIGSQDYKKNPGTRRPREMSDYKGISISECRSRLP